MPTAVWHELGPRAGTCTVCGAEDSLTLGEARFQPNLLERLRRVYCAPPARFATCRDCGWRWTVRIEDVSPAPVARRSGGHRHAARRATDVPTSTVSTPAVPSTTVPTTDVPAAHAPATTVPATTVPATTVPATPVPAADVPTAEGAREPEPVRAARNVLPAPQRGGGRARDWVYPRGSSSRPARTPVGGRDWITPRG
jgi:hypothetical protein